MRVTITLLAGFAALVAAEPVPNYAPQRVNDDRSYTRIELYPFAAALMRYSTNFIAIWYQCGGTIINNRSILSAAQCFTTSSNAIDPPSVWRIRVGSTFASSGGVVYDVAHIITHPDFVFHPRNFDNDIAILRSAAPIVFVAGTIQPASIAGPGFHLDDNDDVWGIGWGVQNGVLTEQLRQVRKSTIPQRFCTTRSDIVLAKVVTNNMVCADDPETVGRDVCWTFAGGALLYNRFIAGVFSSGNCGLSGVPDTYTRVNRYAAWIQSNA